jgi:hypothetical protein
MEPAGQTDPAHHPLRFEMDPSHMCFVVVVGRTWEGPLAEDGTYVYRGSPSCPCGALAVD